jgi:hypothetical protein
MHPQNQVLMVFSYYYYVKLAPKVFTLTQIEHIVNPEAPSSNIFFFLTNNTISYKQDTLCLTL